MIRSLLRKIVLNIIVQYRKKNNKKKTLTGIDKNYSIGIVTFDKRFENFFKPLISDIRSVNKDVEIIVFVNCNYKEKFNEKYKKELLEFLAEYENIYVYIIPEFRSLSKLWNSILVFSSNDGVLLLNDDVSIELGFWEKFENVISINQNKSFTINNSWSHVYLNRKEVNALGWFDERLLGIGEEDGDMRWRWEKMYKTIFPNYVVKGIINYIAESNMSNLSKHSNTKYSKFNREFISRKYKEDSDSGELFGMYDNKMICTEPNLNQYPYEEFYWENKNKL